MDDQHSTSDKRGPGPLTGRTLLHFRFEERLGVGGMGEVYLAVDQKTRRKVAIKVLPEEMSSSARRLKRFQREAEILGSLKHPNILTLYSLEECEGLRFLALELIDGDTLGEQVPRGGLDVQSFLRFAQPIAHALAAAHEQRITHRDLKPSNVMIERSTGTVKVLDFGVAKESHEHDLTKPPSTIDETIPMITQAGGMVGTVPYMSPEQLRGEDATPRSDVFALGALFHEMATGSRPFHALSQAELMAKIMRDEPPAVREKQPKFPVLLERIIDRCLEKDPEKRYADAGEVAAELDAFARRLQSGALTAPLVVRGLLPERSSRRWMVLASVVLAALALGWLVWWGASGAIAGRESATASDESSAFVRLLWVPMQIEGSLEYEHTVRGVEQSLRNVLQEIRGLHLVEAPPDVQTGDLDALLERFSVDAVLDGSVDWSEQNLAGTLTMHLRGSPVLGFDWRDSYTTEPANRAQVNAEIAGDVARQLQLLRPGDEVEPAPMSQVAEAEAAYLRSLNLRRIGQSDAANLSLDEALRLDPEFGLAWAESARALVESIANGGRSIPAPPLGAHRDRLQYQLDQARVFAPNDANTLHAEADYLLRVDLRPEAARQKYRQLLSLTPDRPDLIVSYARALSASGEWKQALVELDNAMRLHPGNPQIRDTLAWFQLVARDFDAAIRSAQSLLELVPGRAFAMEVLHPAMLASGADLSDLRAIHQRFEADGFDVHTRLAYQLAVVEEDWPKASQLLSARRASRYREGDEHGWLHALDMPYAVEIAEHSTIDFDWRGEGAEILRSLEEQLAEHPEDLQLSWFVALVSACLGDVERALSVGEEAVARAPRHGRDQAVTLETLLRVQLLVGDRAAAAGLLDEILALEFGSYWTRDYVARDATLRRALVD